MRCEIPASLAAALPPYCPPIITSRRRSGIRLASIAGDTLFRELYMETDHAEQTNCLPCASRSGRPGWRGCRLPGGGAGGGDGARPAPPVHDRRGTYRAATAAGRSCPAAAGHRDGDHLLAAGTLELERRELGVDGWQLHAACAAAGLRRD